MQRVSNQFPIFLDARGTLMDGGYIYLGVKDANPEVQPIIAYWDSALTTVAEQPLRVVGGLIVNGTTPAQVFVAESDYSMLVEDSNHAQVTYSPSVFAEQSFQPVNANLTAISALATTEFGRQLLTVANQAALQSVAGVAPFNGGTVANAIVKQGAGGFIYFANPLLTGVRIYDTTPGSADPTSQPGDIWFEQQ